MDTIANKYTCCLCKQTYEEENPVEAEQERQQILAKFGTLDGHRPICEKCVERMATRDPLRSLFPDGAQFDDMCLRIKAFCTLAIMTPLEKGGDLMALGMCIRMIAKHHKLDKEAVKSVIMDMMDEHDDYFPCACSVVGEREIAAAMSNKNMLGKSLVAMMREATGQDKPDLGIFKMKDNSFVDAVIQAAREMGDSSPMDIHGNDGPIEVEPREPKTGKDPRSPWRRDD